MSSLEEASKAARLRLMVTTPMEPVESPGPQMLPGRRMSSRWSRLSRQHMARMSPGFMFVPM